MEHKSSKDFQCEDYSFKNSKEGIYCIDIATATEPLCTYASRHNLSLRDSRTKVYRCHLCLHRRQTYFCQDCIEKGNFTHSVSKNLERFADKKLKYFGIKETKTELSTRIADVICTKKNYLQLKYEIAYHKEQIDLLRKGIEEITLAKSKDAERVEQLQKKITDIRGETDRNKCRLKKIQRYNDTCQESVFRKRSNLSCLSLDLQAIRREHALMLTSLIFPISKIELNGSSGEDTLESSESSSSNDSYLLVPFQNPEESHYRILESVLPTSGDYSLYHQWLSNKKDRPTLPGSTTSTSSVHLGSYSRTPRQFQGPPESLRNPAYCISSALTHAAQLVASLAYILDVRLPKSVCYSEFCGHELSRDQFAFKVGKLNANVVYLCLSQGVKSTLIDSPKCTLKNLLLLLHSHTMPPQLGRCSPISVEAHSLLESWPYGGEDEFTDLSLEDLIEDRLYLGASAPSQEWSLEDEEEGWESVPDGIPTDPFLSNVPTRGIPSGYTSVHTQSQARSSLTQTTDTIGGGLIESMASLWRAAVGQK